MSKPFDIEAAKAKLDRMVEDYQPNSRTKTSLLEPFAEQVTDLRQRNASYKVIAEILRSAGINVSHETVSRFCRDNGITKATSRNGKNGHLPRKRQRKHGQSNIRKRPPMTGKKQSFAANLPELLTHQHSNKSHNFFTSCHAQNYLTQ